MLARIREDMIRLDMLHQGDRIVAGVSGGADSVCLLCVLAELRPEYDLKLYAVHIHHGIRGGEADRDAAFTEALCRKLDVECQIVYRDIPSMAATEHCSEEEMGRKVRYQELEAWRERFDCNRIAVAHNREDNAETLLWNLCRGTGLAGLTGIRPVRGHIIRPLLSVSRQEIERWLAEREQEYCIDRTNLEGEYTRNRIRQQILPVMTEEVNSQSVRHITETAGRLSVLQEYLERQAQKEMERISVIDGEAEWREQDYRCCDEALRPEVVLDLLQQISGRMQNFTSDHVAAILELYEREVGKQIDLPYEMVARRTYEGVRLMIGKKSEEKSENSYPLMPEEGVESQVLIPEAGIVLRYRLRSCTDEDREIVKKPENSCTKWFDYDRICNTVVVRTRRVGDRLTIYPDGRSKKLKDYWIDQKVPQEVRDQKWLLAAGSDVLWILGDRTGESCRIDERTRRILVVQIEEPGKEKAVASAEER